MTELKPGEHHPSAISALRYIQSRPVEELYLFIEACASCGIEGNRLSNILASTLNRILKGQPVGERYVLALAFEYKRIHKDDLSTLQESEIKSDIDKRDKC